MYRITVLNGGKYNNVADGSRYCFRKKSAKYLIDLFAKSECDFIVEKLVRIEGTDVFVFSDYEEGDKVFEYLDERMGDE